MIDRIDRWLRANRWNPLLAVLVLAALALIANLIQAQLSYDDMPTATNDIKQERK